MLTIILFNWDKIGCNFDRRDGYILFGLIDRLSGMYIRILLQIIPGLDPPCPKLNPPSNIPIVIVIVIEVMIVIVVEGMIHIVTVNIVYIVHIVHIKIVSIEIVQIMNIVEVV